MDLTEHWNAVDWQTSEFSFAAEDVLAATRRQSASNVTKLLRTYRRLYYSSIGYLLATPLLALLKPHDSEYVCCIGFIGLYWLVMVGFLTHTFLGFKLPDLAQQPTLAIRQTLKLVRSINAFHTHLIEWMVPVVFLGSMLATLTYGGTRFGELTGNPIVPGVVIGTTLLVVGLSRWLRRRLVNRQCVALIHQLDEQLRTLTTA